MALLYQNEKNLLISLAAHYEQIAEHCKVRAEISAVSKEMYLKQAEDELEKAHVLRKAVH